MSILSGAEGYAALTSGAGAVRLERDFISVVGPDAERYLQGQLSQDVSALAVGQAAPTLILSPQGKLVALLRVLRTGPDSFVVDTDPGWGEPVAERLNRFKLRTACSVEAVPWQCVALRGAGTPGMDRGPSGEGVWSVAAPGWPASAGLDLVGPAVEAPDGVDEVDPEAYEVVRVACGVPRMGTELDESTIPASAGVVESSVSFTKGCYTGQELVARIDSRGGNVPRRLRSLAWSGQGVVAAGSTLHQGGAEVGRVTSASSLPDGSGGVALGYLVRAAEVPGEVETTDEGGATVVLTAQPLPGSDH